MWRQEKSEKKSRRGLRSSERCLQPHRWLTKPDSTQKRSNNAHLDTRRDREPQIVLVNCVKLFDNFFRADFHWSTRRRSWEIQLMYAHRRALRWEFRCLCKQPTQHEHGIMITTDVLDCLRSNVLFPEILSWEGRESGARRGMWQEVSSDRSYRFSTHNGSCLTYTSANYSCRTHTALAHNFLFPKHHPSMFHCYRWTSSSLRI